MVWRKAAMGVGVAALLLLAAEAALRFAGVRPPAVRADPLVGFAASPSLFERVTGPDGTDRYRTRDTKLAWFNRQSFPARKAPGTMRVFCLGGSTTYGRPYEDDGSFCGWLRTALRRAYPDERWEVINAGGISYASYRVARLMEELVQYEPDLFVVYTGHNEFLEARTYGTVRDRTAWEAGVRGAAQHSALYATMQRALRPEPTPAAQLPGEVATRLDRSIGPEDYTRDDEAAADVVAHFRLSLERMVAWAEATGAAIVFVEPVANHSAMSPFRSVSTPGLDDAARTAWADALAEGRAALEHGDADAAVASLQRATPQNPRHAHTWYALGRALQATDATPTAGAAFARAVDEDVCPLRMTSRLREVLRAVAREHEVLLVDAPAALRVHSAAAGHGPLPGAAWFHDHVHPTLEGYGVIARALTERLVTAGLVTLPEAWGEADWLAVGEDVAAGLDHVAGARALRNVGKVLSWAGKHAEAEAPLRQAVTLVPDDPEAWYTLGVVRRRIGQQEPAEQAYRRAIELAPDYAQAHNNLADILARRGDAAGAVQHFRAAIEADPALVEAHFNLGNFYAAAGRFEPAAAAYRRALLYDPDHVAVLGNLANVTAARGDLPAAIQLYERVLRLDPQNPVARRNLPLVRAQVAKP